jgi:hypothetical protein
MPDVPKPKRVKLTPRQIECLSELAKPGAKAHYMRYMGSFNPNAYWFITTDHKKRTSQVETLCRLGLLNVKKDSLGYADRATINAAGRKVLLRDGTATLPVPEAVEVQAKVEEAQ